MLEQVGLHQVVEDVVLTDPLHRTATGGAEGRTLHPTRITGSAKRMHAGLKTVETHTNTHNYKTPLTGSAFVFMKKSTERDVLNIYQDLVYRD